MKIFFFVYIIFFGILGTAAETSSAANDHATRPRTSEELNKESSSFIADPNSLDPLPVKKENLKEDEEPVLEDIRQVLDAPTKKKKPAPGSSMDNSNAGEGLKKTKSKKKMIAKKAKSDAKTLAKNEARIEKKKKSVSVSIKRKSKSKVATELNQDDPDLKLERKYNSIYKAYNSNPTSVGSWNTVINGRPSQFYTVQKNDTLWSISKTLFADPNYWPKLWSVNKQGISNPHQITPGLKVFFYPGTNEETPTLAVSDGEGKADSEVKGEAKADSEGTLKVLDDGSGAQSKAAGIIPDSLPLSRNDNYHLPPQVLKIELRNNPAIPDNDISDIILSDSKIVSEVEFSLSEIVKGRCGGDHIIKTSSLKSTEGILKVYEQIETLNSEDGPLFPYRYVGQAKVISENKIKITSCTSVMSRFLVFLSPSQVNSWRSTKTNNHPVPMIVGGPNLGTQVLFANRQLAYIDLGSQTAEIGQILKVKSQLTELTSGEIRILDKFGSYAIGVVSEVEDLIETGDELSFK